MNVSRVTLLALTLAAIVATVSAAGGQTGRSQEPRYESRATKATVS